MTEMLQNLKCKSPESRGKKRHNKTAQPKVYKYPTSHFSPFNCCLSECVCVCVCVEGGAG